MNDFTEDALVEQPAITLFSALGWETINAFKERFGKDGTLGRENRSQVVLTPRLMAALRRLNPALPQVALDGAVEELSRDRSALNPVEANRAIYRLLKDGINVAFRDADEGERVETVYAVDWANPANNDFLLVSQLWITGDVYTRRADLVGFVNGLPLLFIELKATHKRVQDAYEKNLRDYKDTIPQIFWYNAFIILSNARRTHIGTISAAWEQFAEWKKVADEAEPGSVSLETAIRGTCTPDRLLDIAENFIVFSDAGGRRAKLIARYHQYLGVNNAVAAVAGIEHNAGRLGVFWHTQGSGKSLSMLFFSQKVLRKLPGSWTFVVVTDRQELDDQIYKTFAGAGATTESETEVHADSAEHLRRLLREDHRYVFTLIQKFRTAKGETHPEISPRADIIVITDEAHRSQYDALALNMRNALPNAAFIGFTGTPLMAGEEKTREVFGDYVSRYDFKQSVDDAATVPLYYENRIPELQLTNDDLNEELAELIEEADLDDAGQAALERQFARQYHLITRDDRLEKIAADLVDHFLNRGESGKAMVVSIDKATAVRMYDKVQKYWQLRLDTLRWKLRAARTDGERAALAKKIAYLETTDMAVIVSQSQNEVDDLRHKGADILPHRKRMMSEDLELNFKNPNHPLRIVFLCAMWITGFDVPSLSTVYLDKPMRNHTLMQTIARANRVFGKKNNGLIVDYIGVFRDLQRALAIYGSGAGDENAPGETPVADKSKLITELRTAITETRDFLRELGVDIDEIMAAARAGQSFLPTKLLQDALEAILSREATRERYFALARQVARLYKAILPDRAASEFSALVALFARLIEMYQSEIPEVDISSVMSEVEDLLDLSIAAEGYVIEGPGRYSVGQRIDLSKFDFDALKQSFAQGQKHIATERLKCTINARIRRMVRLNKRRTDYEQKFNALIDDYNAGATSIDLFFSQLAALMQELNAEEQRAATENMSEEELAVYDLLSESETELSPAEKEQVKQVAHDLIDKLKVGLLVLDWRKRQQSRAQVRLAIEEDLDRGLPQTYTSEMLQDRADALYQHIYDSYYGSGQSIYEAA